MALTLRTHDGKGEVDPKELRSNLIALYFSAHWCPPCRAFTPVLKDFYNEIRDKVDPSFQIIFVSSDKSEEQLNAYMKESHGEWLAMPYGSKFIDAFKKKYGVKGIPSLVVLDGEWNEVSRTGRQDISKAGLRAYKKWWQNAQKQKAGTNVKKEA